MLGRLPYAFTEQGAIMAANVLNSPQAVRMPKMLYDVLPRDENLTSDHLLGRFLHYVAGRRLTLYPAQGEAVLEFFEEENVILNTSTGSGKSLVVAAPTVRPPSPAGRRGRGRGFRPPSASSRA